MTPFQFKANRLIEYFGETINTPLSLKNGVCALYDTNNQESAIIEVPEFSESIIFHCSLSTLPTEVSVQTLRDLLLLNFEISAMQGCWLAIDESEKICLCHTLSIEATDEQTFCDSLVGFIEQVKDVRLFITDLLQPEKTH